MTMIAAFLFIRFVLVVVILNVTYGRTVPQPTGKMRGASLPPCPPSCTCFQNNTVVCDGRHLTKVPSDLPARTTALYLNNSHLHSLNIQALSELKGLEAIHLRGGTVKEVHVRQIKSLPQLRHLDLQESSVVCDCNMARLIENAWDDSKLHIQLGDAECSSPKNHRGKKAVGVLAKLQCSRTRDRRHAGVECIVHNICQNGGTCQVRFGVPFCICPVGFIGLHCEVPQFTPHGSGGDGEASLHMQMREHTHDSITITWESPSGVVKFLVSLYYYHETHHNPAVWTTNTRYTFNGLQPATRYELCVSAYAEHREMLTEECEVYQTSAMPLPGTSPGSDSPGGWFPEEPSTDDYDDKKVIRKAAIILGSIIGLCALLVVFLTLVHKFRPFRRPRQNTSSSSYAAQTSPSNAAHTEGIPVEENPVVPQTEDTQDAGREIFVVSVSAPEDASGSLVDRGGPPGVLLPGESSTSTPESSALQDVLRAIKNSTSQPSRGSGRGSNPMVLYQPNSRGSPVAEHRGSSLASASGNAPIFILSDGNQYPLDSTLSNVLRTAMVGPGAQQLPLPPAHPQEPPPPYSETPEEDMVSLPQEAATLAPSAPPESQYQPSENCETDATSLVVGQEER